jgi:hypothetical protein
VIKDDLCSSNDLKKYYFQLNFPFFFDKIPQSGFTYNIIKLNRRFLDFPDEFLIEIEEVFNDKLIYSIFCSEKNNIQ